MMVYEIKEKEPVIQTNYPANAVIAALNIAWSELRSIGIADETICGYLTGVCATVNLRKVNEGRG